MDRAQHTPGQALLEEPPARLPAAISMVIVDGVMRAVRSRNTPPATTLAEAVTT